jgi:hypothetical protein
MSIMEKIKGMLSKHSDKVERGLDQAAKTADKRTGGKYGERIGTAKEKAKEYIPKGQGGAEGQEGGRPPEGGQPR